MKAEKRKRTRARGQYVEIHPSAGILDHLIGRNMGLTPEESGSIRRLRRKPGVAAAVELSEGGVASARRWLKAVARGEERPSLGSLTAYVWGLQGTPTGELLEGMTDREARDFLHRWLKARLADAGR